MSCKAAVAALGALAAASGIAVAQHRELGAHEHGRGALNIALEGVRVAMELEVPGVDIIGFEHPARTRQEMSAVEQGKKQLLAALALFALPPAAGCEVMDAKVALEEEEEEEETAAEGALPRSNLGHSQFLAQYALECASPAHLTGIDFWYFRAFVAAQKLDVTLITPRGQSTFTADRARPHIDLVGVM